MTHSKSRTAARKHRHVETAPPVPVAEHPIVAPPTAHEVPLGVRFGRQLRAAREARHRGIEDCARELHLPARVLKKLEAGDHAGISEAVYLRNYLASYGACVGLRKDSVQAAIEELAPAERQPQLVSTGGIPRSHYLWRRLTTFGTSAVLTAVIVVPLVWLGLKGGLDRELTRLEPLSPAPVGVQATAGDPRGTGATVPVDPTRVEKPLMASMAPFSALDSVDASDDSNAGAANDADASPAVPPPAPVVQSASHSLSIALSMPSWVEVTTAAGKRLEYSLLPAGTHKVYHSSRPLRVSIGDTSAARVRVDGKRIDLAAYRHANVAHFRIVPKDGQAVVKPM